MSSENAKRIPLTKGFYALVDAEDYEAIVASGPWQAKVHGRTAYARRGVRLPDGRRTTQYMHSLITELPMVDHVNGDGLDNRKTNLRPCTKTQNAANHRMKRTSNSGFKGVTWYPRSERWHARLRAGRKTRSLGYYATREEAARAYDIAAIARFGEFAHTNFPRENYA